jgi:hypothetical protein
VNILGIIPAGWEKGKEKKKRNKEKRRRKKGKEREKGNESP